MDPMLLRAQGRPQNPWLRRLTLVCFRLCLAASFAGKNAETLLGPHGHRLKSLFEKIACSSLVLRLFIKDAGRVIGIGGQSIVIRSKGGRFIEKYNYVMAGSDQTALETYIYDRQRDLRELQLHFGDIAIQTTYSVARLPARAPLGRLLTIRAVQSYHQNVVDIFSTEGQKLLQDMSNAALRAELLELVHNIRQLASENLWLDIVGPENVVLALDGQTPRLRILDTEFYTAEYMDDVNPVLGRSYRAVFRERLSLLERLSRSYITPWPPADRTGLSGAVIPAAQAA